MFTKQFITSKKLYNNSDELEQYIIDNIPSIKNIIDTFTTEQEYEEFILELYDRIIAKININDNYLLMYINYIILNCISNKSFLDQFFIPLYNIFIRYLFPIELDFINKIEDKYSIKDKFESFGTSDTLSCSIKCDGFMSKILQTPDIVKLYFIKKHEDDTTHNDKVFFLVKSFERNELKYSNFIKININSKFFDKKTIKDLSQIIVKSSQEDPQSLTDQVSVEVQSFQNDLNDFNENININISSRFLDPKNNFNEKISFNIKTSLNDPREISDRESINLNRYPYINDIDDLNLYLIFQNEQYRKQSSYEQNLYYKSTSISDEIYFNFHKFF
jgi:hypothetical protein